MTNKIHKCLNLLFITSRKHDELGSQSCTHLPGLPSDSSPSTSPVMDNSNKFEGPSFSIHGPDTDLSAFRPSLRQRSASPASPASPVPSSSVHAPSCSSSFRMTPVSSPDPLFAEDNSLNTVSSVKPPPAFSPTTTSAFTPASSSGHSSSVRAGPPPSPTLGFSLRSPPCSSPISSSSTFTRSLAASCISQSLSQSMARKNSALQQAQNSHTVNEIPSTHLQRHSLSPKPLTSQLGFSTPAHTQLGSIKDGHQSPKCSPSPPSPFSQHSHSLSMNMAHHHSSNTSPRPSFLHSKTHSLQNSSNNNNNVSLVGVSFSNISNTSSPNINIAVSNGGWSVTSQKTGLTNGSHDLLWSGSHNRVPRPFSASEPSSQVQSPSPSPTPASFSRMCSPAPQHNYSSMANKPPHPRSPRVASSSSHNSLGLTLELPRASSASSVCLSPRILSPPPIGVSVNFCTSNVAAPQPRNIRYASSSPSPSFSASLGSPTLENASFPTSSSTFVSLQSSRASSPSSFCPPAPQITSETRRSSSSSLADTPSSPVGSTPTGLRCSRVDSSRRSLEFSGNDQGSFELQESCPTSPRSGWSSYSSSPSCLSPQAGLQSPISPSHCPPGKNSLGGQHFTSVPWPDVRELSNKYNGNEILDTSVSSAIIASSSSHSSSSHTLLSSSPGPSDSQTEWGDPHLEEGNCRSQLICAYVPRSSQEPNLPSLCMSSTPLAPYQSQSKPQPQVQITTTTPPLHPIPSPIPSNSSPLPFTQSCPAKQRNHKPSYATTVNLQIAGSGRITSFSTAQVSLTQTLQGGAGAPGQGIRRVSINGLSPLPSPLPQNCNRL